jgi:hypothetical protein
LASKGSAGDATGPPCAIDADFLQSTLAAISIGAEPLPGMIEPMQGAVRINSDEVAMTRHKRLQTDGRKPGLRTSRHFWFGKRLQLYICPLHR